MHQVVSFSGGRTSAYLVHLMEAQRKAGASVHFIFMDRERLVLDAATRTAAGGEMMDVKEKVLQVMRSRAALQDKALGGEYPFRMATWNLRLAMEKEFPDEEWRSADLRKILMELAKDGTVSKDTHASRIGQAVWRLEVR